MGYKPPVIHFWGINGFSTDYNEWGKWRILAVFGAGTLGLIAVIVLLGLLYKYISKSWAILKLFAWWLLINSLGVIASNLAGSIVGVDNYNSIYYSDFAVIIPWWGFPPFLLYASLFLFALLLLITGYAFVNTLLRFSHSRKLVSRYYGRLQVINFYFVIPLIAGSLILLPFVTEALLYLAFHVFALIILLMGMMIRINGFYELNGVYRVDISKNKPWFLLMLSLLMILPVLNK